MSEVPAPLLPSGVLPSVALTSPALPLLGRLLVLGARGGRPILVLNAPVGAGKSTLARSLQQLAHGRGLRLAVASIDDAYLPWAERQRAMAGNPFGVDRVPPGSHDTQLLVERLQTWRRGGALQLPRFDKTLRAGRGDRSGEESLEADVLLLEGWLLGCRPLPQAQLEAWIGQQAALPQREAEQLCGAEQLSERELAWLPHWNRTLASYGPLGLPELGLVDELWTLQPTDWRFPLRWRLQAEARQRRCSGQAMEAATVARMVRATLASLPPALYQQPLLRTAAVAGLLDGRRRCRWCDQVS